MVESMNSRHLLLVLHDVAPSTWADYQAFVEAVDALGHATTCFNSISNLRKRGRHIQVGLMLAEHSMPQIPMGKVIAHELEILGSHGMQAHRYGDMLAMIQSGKLSPQKLIGKTISLEQSIDALMNMDKFEAAGVTVVTKF